MSPLVRPHAETAAIRPFDPHRGRGLDQFIIAFKPHIRPEGQLRRLRTAFDIDAGFEQEFRLLRPWLRQSQRDWVDRIVRDLLHFEGIRSGFDAADHARLGRLYRRHAALFAAGRFDETYLASLEDVALFFLYHEVRSVWLAGAYGRIEETVVDTLFELAATRKDMPLRRLMRAFSKGMTIELSQIQRVFICYERRLIEIALSDLALAGVAPRLVEALRDGLAVATERRADLARRWCGRLEASCPEALALLPSDAEGREAALLGAFGVAVETLGDHGASAIERIRAFGASQADGPLGPEHRRALEDATLGALADAFGRGWSEEIARAAAALYRRVSLLALDAREAARAETGTAEIGAGAQAASGVVVAGR